MKNPPHLELHTSVRRRVVMHAPRTNWATVLRTPLNSRTELDVAPERPPDLSVLSLLGLCGRRGVGRVLYGPPHTSRVAQRPHPLHRGDSGGHGRCASPEVHL
eukprot:4437694-Pyramimonas_sp.AAC.1